MRQAQEEKSQKYSTKASSRTMPPLVVRKRNEPAKPSGKNSQGKNNDRAGRKRTRTNNGTQKRRKANKTRPQHRPAKNTRKRKTKKEKRIETRHQKKRYAHRRAKGENPDYEVAEEGRGGQRGKKTKDKQVKTEGA